MNKPTGNPQESSDPLVDALLSEHARLGAHDDVGLLATIRARTVDIPAPLPFPEPKANAFSRADRWKVAAMVAGVLALIGVVVSHIETAHPETDTLQLVMRPISFNIDPIEEASPEDGSPRTWPAKAIPADTSAMPELDFPPPNVESLALAVSAAGNSREEESGGYAFDQFASLLLPSTELLAQVSVAANRTIRDEDSESVIYEGSVRLAHPDFRLVADRLEFSKRTEGEKDRFGTFVATGDAVRVEKRTPAGTVQLAEGQRVSYDANGATLTLSGGPPRLKVGGSLVTPDSLDGEIVLRQDGFQVIETAMLGTPGAR